MEPGERGRGKRAGLTRAAILETAKELAHDPAPGAFSVRALGGRLGVDPMAIHYHFGGRSKLLDALASDLLGSIASNADRPWDERLRGIALEIFRLAVEFGAVDWTARKLRGSAGEMRVLAEVGEALNQTGLPGREAATAAHAILALAFAEGTATIHGDPDGRARHRQGTALLIDGLRMRVLERRVAAGEE